MGRIRIIRNSTRRRSGRRRIRDGRVVLHNRDQERERRRRQIERGILRPESRGTLKG